MNKIKNWKFFLYENLESSHEERFNRAIYLTYVERHEKFKHISKEEFYDKLYNDNLERMKTITYDKTNIYRLADEKIQWLTKNNHILGEVWCEDDIKSYWINQDI